VLRQLGPGATRAQNMILELRSLSMSPSFLIPSSSFSTNTLPAKKQDTSPNSSGKTPLPSAVRQSPAMAVHPAARAMRRAGL
jgi:hypothetical protein